MIRTLIAAAAFSMTSLAIAGDGCPSAATPCSGDKAAVTTVANDKDGSCDKPCTGEAAVTQVADTASKSCGATDKAAAITQVANAEGETCSKPCDSGAATTKVAYAEGETCSKPCDGSAKASTTSLVSYMPKMSYRVSGEDTCCPKTAETMAKEHNGSVNYVVNNVAYDTKPEAIEAHAAQLKAYMMDLVRIQYAVDGECVPCPTAAKEKAASCESKKMQYRVGPASFDCAEKAIAASVMAYNAAKKVSMQYAVGEDTTTCSVGAKTMAKKANCSVEYVVNGKRTNCSKEAGYLQTVASVESALKALETAATGAGA